MGKERHTQSSQPHQYSASQVESISSKPLQASAEACMTEIINSESTRSVDSAHSSFQSWVLPFWNMEAGDEGYGKVKYWCGIHIFLLSLSYYH